MNWIELSSTSESATELVSFGLTQIAIMFNTWKSQRLNSALSSSK